MLISCLHRGIFHTNVSCSRMHVRAIGKVVNELIEEPVTYVKESNPKDHEPHGVMLAVTTRFEEEKVRKAIRKVDPKAYIVVTSAHEVIGKVSEGSLYRDVSPPPRD